MGGSDSNLLNIFQKMSHLSKVIGSVSEKLMPDFDKEQQNVISTQNTIDNHQVKK